MPAERTPMRRVREILRLKFVGDVSIREIAHRVGVVASAVSGPWERCDECARSGWPRLDLPY
jgi:predicted DNA-binding protein YlxM (UPF0122 family)